ncbi:hypothetical protein SNOG_06411 [Parastagonospora nodorum SN15]|uniref:Heterokaryon incompatibility domain-containing protein n=1 Tax=Phaeosphaeria nodorum (strain SN15 / ATCC MYA-4574 / FGSC 10173) TaxID=321614 RepID=Q0UPA3_PHANO|nr:hypothetical protein SNOG_06411 [Parastagonospora nodorum SN15]EAT86242.1 hypothetical protein SNOG_06411 [Parastagonospora nodorum SN15]
MNASLDSPAASRISSYRHSPLDQEKKSIRLLQVLPGESEDPIRIAGSDGAWLWVDALCINQDNILERNHQVGQMKDIYQGAGLVITWLGAATDDDRLAFRALQEDTIAPGRWPWDAWYQLFRKPYWRRIWIIQEFVLGEENHLWCGNLRADTDDFWRAGENLDGIHNVRETLGWRLLILRRLWSSNNHSERRKQMDLRKLSTSFAISNSTDPRDYVYGFLGIAYISNEKGLGLVPDYSKSAAEVAIDVVRIHCRWAPALFPISSRERTAQTLAHELTQKLEYERYRKEYESEDNESNAEIRVANSQAGDLNASRLLKQRQALRDIFRGERFKGHYLSQHTISRPIYPHNNMNDEIDLQDELVRDHDFISHLMRKLGVSRSTMASLVLEKAPDLRAHMHIIVAKDWRELHLCREGGHGATTDMLIGIFGFEACVEMELVSGRAEPGDEQRRSDFESWADQFKLEPPTRDSPKHLKVPDAVQRRILNRDFVMNQIMQKQ